MRSLVSNMVTGVTDGFEKRLEIVGVGYRAEVKGKQVHLSVGYSKPVVMEIPKELETVAESPTRLVVRGASKQRVGQFAAEIRRVRKPEPYKGKGIRYADERVRRKVGKAGVGS
jgi:large subunit ribosomal protein L6